MRKWVQASAVACIFIFVFISSVFAQGNVVRAILFYSPYCGYCHIVISEHMPPLIAQYDATPEVLFIPPSEAEESEGPSVVGIFANSLEILYVNTATEMGNVLYWNAIDRFQITQQAVPLLIVGETVLVGGNEIPAVFPGIVEEGLAGEGIDWPDISGLGEAIAMLVPVPEEPPVEETSSAAVPVVITPVTDLSVIERIKLDPVGNSLSIIVLLGMLVSLALAMGRIMLPEEEEQERGISWLVLLLCVIGIVVAGYLTYVESSGEVAVCGPVGDCNTVQQSEYARLFGVIPVGGVGLAGYVGIIAAWLASRYLKNPLSDWAKVALLVMALFGTAFSAYLTFLEPFVIGATCAWCLTSSVIITAIMLLALPAGVAAGLKLRRSRLQTAD